MCGLTGRVYLDARPVKLEELQEMTDAIRHRGPDGEGHWIEKNVGLGHRRLAVIDPSARGKQPMLSRDGRYVLTYNGELYNYASLRELLMGRGYVFSSETDTEVVLYALIEWGPEAVTRFNGMFALAMFDRVEKNLLLARDRYGVKPLYYSNHGQTFSFGSEQKAVFAGSNFDRKLNTSALVEYLTFQNIFSDQTLTEDVHLLPPGHIATLNTSTGKWVKRQYWDFNFSTTEDFRDERPYVEELRRLLNQAVSRQLVSDVEVGAYLSGGIDSASIASISSKCVESLPTFTVGFDLRGASDLELGFDERRQAEDLSSAFGTQEYQMVLKSGDMEKSLEAIAHHLEEPRVGQSYPNYYAAKLASGFVKVVLSGSGGDELFGGYPWRYFQPSMSQSFPEFVSNYYAYWQRLLGDDERQALLLPIWDQVKGFDPREIFENVFQNQPRSPNSPADYVNLCLYFEAKTFLHGLLLVEDKLSMAFGLETRVPFLDNDLVDFAMRCPVRLKMSASGQANGVPNENKIEEKYLAKAHGHGKKILRTAVSPLLGPSYSQSRKQGFSSPDSSWFRGKSSALISSLPNSDDGLFGTIFDQAAMNELIQSHLTGEKNRRLLIWSLLSLRGHFRWNGW